MMRDYWWRHFRAQVLVLILLGVLVLTLALAFVGASVTVAQLEQSLQQDNAQLLRIFSQQSRLALLFDSPENADSALMLMRQFEGVQRLAIVRNDGEVLAGDPLPDNDGTPWRSIDNNWLIIDGEDHWRYWVPVIAQSASDEDGQSLIPAISGNEQLGSVYLQRSKARLLESRKKVLLFTALSAAGAGALIALILNVLLRRIVKPVYELSALMAVGRAQGQYPRVREAGAEEIRQMARQFNQLMQTLADSENELRQHRDQLENDVQQRTRELVHARDAALAAYKAKSEFLANISHELRTPLQGIIGYGDVLHEELLVTGDAQLINDVERIVSNATHLLEIINNILDMAKIEAGRMTVNQGACDFRVLIRDVAAMVKPLIERGNNLLQIQIDGELQEPLITDQQKLRQILLNLLSNAAKFTTNGTITVHAYRLGDYLKISVHDTGIGIPTDMQEHIFEQFQQVDGSEARRHGGTGLGLSITRHFCELLAGTIHLHSETNKGSIFTVSLPYQSINRNV